MADNGNNLGREFNVLVNCKYPTSEGNGLVQFGLPGYLSDEGLNIELKHNYANVLEFAGSIFDTIRNVWAGSQALGNIENGELKITMGKNIKGYIQGGILLNAPYYWTGTDPISFTLSMYQIAQKEGDIINNYQNLLTLLSPNIDVTSPTSQFIVDTLGTFGSQNNIVNIGAMGPSLIDVYYFPSSVTVTPPSILFGVPIPGSFQAEGGIQFQNCLCSLVSCEIKGPYDKLHSPIIGVYRFQLQTARILNSNQIKEIFKITEQQQ